jgi:hypothetical protein
MTAPEALAFVEKHGIVLVSAKGPVPRLTEALAGEPIKGSWWAHPMSHEIFGVLQALARSEDVLTCRLVNGKVTLVHSRLWPALVRTAKRFSKDQLAKVWDEHTPSGRHASRKVAFPKWVPDAVKRRAKKLGEEEALEALGPWAR